MEKLIFEVYADRLDGGPENASTVMRKQISMINRALDRPIERVRYHGYRWKT